MPSLSAAAARRSPSVLSYDTLLDASTWQQSKCLSLANGEAPEHV